jgi:hypothetical protein
VTHAATETGVTQGGRHRRGRTSWVRFAALGLAVTAAVVLVVISLRQPGKKPAPAPSSGPANLASAWPTAVVVDSRGQLADGAAYSPWIYLDAQTSVGTAATPDGTADRLLLRTGNGEPRELRRVPKDSNPQWSGFATAGDDLVWAESTAGADGKGETRLWRANWRSTDPPVSLTVDTGDIVFFNSQYDLVIAEGAVHWAAAARTETPVTELRSIPLAGGTVSVAQVPGAYAMSAWPWLVSVGTGQAGPVDMINLQTKAQVKVPAAATELVTCSPVWCRVLIISGTGGPARIDLMRADGTDRRKVASGNASPAIMDVALMDRFEVLSIDSNGSSPTSSQEVLVYDATAQRVVSVATGAGTVLARGTMLWWSTGDNEALVWHALDLQTLKS